MIAIDATPLTETAPGGVRRALALLVEGLAALPDRPAIHLVTPGPLAVEVPPLDGLLVAEPGGVSPRGFRRRQLPALLDRIGARVLFEPFAATARVALPVVAFVHELPHVRWGSIEGPGRRWRFARAARLAASRARAVCVPTEATKEDLVASTGVPASRVHVTGNAFDPGPWAAARLGVDGPVDVVVVGTGTRVAGPRKKGMDVLAEVARRLPARTFHLVGDPPGALPPNVAVRGRLADDALRRLVASACALLHPARSEGFGYPVLEAMAAGVPVVATCGGGLPEVAGDAALLVAPGDAASATAALERVLGEADLRRRLVARGRERATAFAPPVVARRVLEVLEEAAA